MPYSLFLLPLFSFSLSFSLSLLLCGDEGTLVTNKAFLLFLFL